MNDLYYQKWGNMPCCRTKRLVKAVYAGGTCGGIQGVALLFLANSSMGAQEIPSDVLYIFPYIIQLQCVARV